jgi:Bacterial SH3 domain
MVIVRSMPLRKADGPLTVHVPSPGDDRPSWLGVGAIAVVGFVVGVAWPHLAGVRLGPSVPEGPAASASAAEPAPSGLAPVVPAAIAAPVAPPASPGLASPSSATAAAPAAGSRGINVAHGAVFACKTAGGESLKGNDCGALAGLDGLVLPRLRKLADCPEAATTSGKLHLVVRADFTRDAVTVDLGREHGVATAEPLLACAKNAMGSVSLAGIAHDNARYSVAYAVTFAGPAAAATPAASLSAAADGTAQVEWEVAIVRDAPRTGGKVLARLPRGTPLRVGASKDGWYPVKYGDGFGSDGWVYRGAIGK